MKMMRCMARVKNSAAATGSALRWEMYTVLTASRTNVSSSELTRKSGRKCVAAIKQLTSAHSDDGSMEREREKGEWMQI